MKVYDAYMEDYDELLGFADENVNKKILKIYVGEDSARLKKKIDELYSRYYALAKNVRRLEEKDFYPENVEKLLDGIEEDAKDVVPSKYNVDIVPAFIVKLYVKILENSTYADIELVDYEENIILKARAHGLRDIKDIAIMCEMGEETQVEVWLKKGQKNTGVEKKGHLDETPIAFSFGLKRAAIILK